MAFVYSGVRDLESTKKVGSRQCVALVQYYLPSIGPTLRWQPGEPVFLNKSIRPGTAIATFVHGKYPNRPHGNHAALFLCHGSNGFWVMDQWSDDKKKPLVSSRFIHQRGQQLKSGAYPYGGDNALAYSIIER